MKIAIFLVIVLVLAILVRLKKSGEIKVLGTDPEDIQERLDLKMKMMRAEENAKKSSMQVRV